MGCVRNSSAFVGMNRPWHAELNTVLTGAFAAPTLSASAPILSAAPVFHLAAERSFWDLR